MDDQNRQMAPATVLYSEDKNDVTGFNNKVNPGYVAESKKSKIKFNLKKYMNAKYITLGIIGVLLLLSITCLFGYFFYDVAPPSMAKMDHLVVKEKDYDLLVRVNHIQEKMEVETYQLGVATYDKVNISVTNNSVNDADLSKIEFIITDKFNRIITSDVSYLAQTQLIDEFPKITFLSGVTLTGYLYFESPIKEGSNLGIGIPDKDGKMSYSYIRIS